MKELDDLLAAYSVARENGESCLVATLVRVEGSSYRQLGARMLLTGSGGRTGGMSGGCLEAEIQKKAWWLTERGPVIERYQTSGEEGMNAPYGLGCNGTLHILLKRVDDIDAARLQLLSKVRALRSYASIATILSGRSLGSQRLYPGEDYTSGILASGAVETALKRVAGQHISETMRVEQTEILVEALVPRPRVVIFGAGNDALPLVQFARLLGWDVTVADARSHLATWARFPQATAIVSAPLPMLAKECKLREDDAVVLMTHSFEQDQELLSTLLSAPLRYLGQLGPRHRTQQLLASAATDNQLHGLQNTRLHSPIGLNIGGHTPETIALSIIAEIQSVLSSQAADSARERKQHTALQILA